MSETTQTTVPALSGRLRASTAALHEELDGLVMSAKPFDTIENYGRFVAAQYLFQRDIESLYEHPSFLAMIPDLSTRPRLAAAAADLGDLNVPIPGAVDGIGDLPLPEGLGWLYVSEGSKLGAAFLFKEAGAKLGVSETFGARNLAAPEGGRAPTWKRFVEVLDNNDLSEAERERVIAGARAAFARFALHLRACYGLDAAVA